MVIHEPSMKLQDCEAERDDAMRRFDDMEARWNEEKMRKRAAALFGSLTQLDSLAIHRLSVVPFPCLKPKEASIVEYVRVRSIKQLLPLPKLIS